MNYPEPIVGALILNEDGEVLLIKQAKWNNQYCIPGGHVELEESIENALKREIKEEVGLNVSVLKLLGLQDNINSESFHRKKHFIFLDYVCRAISDDVKIDNKEVERLEKALRDIDSVEDENFRELFKASNFSQQEFVEGYEGLSEEEQNDFLDLMKSDKLVGTVFSQVLDDFATMTAQVRRDVLTSIYKMLNYESESYLFERNDVIPLGNVVVSGMPISKSKRVTMTKKDLIDRISDTTQAKRG